MRDKCSNGMELVKIKCAYCDQPMRVRKSALGITIYCDEQCAESGRIEKQIEKHNAGKGKQKMKTKHLLPKDLEPCIEQLEEWSQDTGCEATDGCWVEHDGKCEHGHVSWFLYLGLI